MANQTERVIDPFINIPNRELPPIDLFTMKSNQQSQNFFGTMNVGNNKIKIDGQNKRIVWFDDDGVPIIVIGEV